MCGELGWVSVGLATKGSWVRVATERNQRRSSGAFDEVAIEVLEAHSRAIVAWRGVRGGGARVGVVHTLVLVTVAARARDTRVARAIVEQEVGEQPAAAVDLGAHQHRECAMHVS